MKRTNSYYHKRHDNPRRGGPGILLTCESGRENKCQREGLELLAYYWNKQHQGTSREPGDKEKQSIDDEIAQLKRNGKKGRNESFPFQVFHTGCRGTVFLLLKGDDIDGREPSQPQEKETEAEPPVCKKLKGSEEEKGTSTNSTDPQSMQKEPPVGSWNPIDMVKQIASDRLADIANRLVDHSNAPGSRFVTRVIPLQRTCAAHLDAIAEAVEQLLTGEMATRKATSSRPKTTTFAISSKRRNCSHLSSKGIIDTVASLVDKVVEEQGSSNPWKVDLKSPDLTIWIEICQKIAGVSIVPQEILQLSPKFNIMSLQDNE